MIQEECCIMLRNSWEANILLVGKKEIKAVTLVIEIKGV